MTTEAERIAVLETKLDVVTEKLEHVATRLEALTALLEKAKGAKWLAVLIASGLIALGSKLGGILAWLYSIK